MKHSLNEPGAYRWPHRPPKLIDYDSFMLPTKLGWYKTRTASTLTNLLTDARRHDRSTPDAQPRPKLVIEPTRSPTVFETRISEMLDRWRDYR